MKYIEYYPTVLKEIYEIQLLSGALDNVLDEAKEIEGSLVKEFYINTATERGIELWEKALKLDVTDSDIEIRRFKVLSKILGDKTSLRTKLDALLGEDKYRINMDAENCHVTFDLELSVHSLKPVIVNLIEKILPLNITYEINLAYNRHLDLTGYTHEQLGKYTNKEINSEKL